MNVSSVVVRTRPEHHAEVLRFLEASDLCSVHFDDREGRIVVTIEGKDSSEEMDKVRRISAAPNVLSAELAFAYSEDDFKGDADEGGGPFGKPADPVPDILKDNT